MAASSSSAGTTAPSGEIFDPATGTWTDTNPLVDIRGQSSAALLQDGRVLIAGGGSDNTVGSAELFDPTTGVFAAVQDMSVWRASATATVLPDGRVLVVGGFGADQGAAQASAELFDPVDRDLDDDRQHGRRPRGRP